MKKLTKYFLIAITISVVLGIIYNNIITQAKNGDNPILNRTVLKIKNSSSEDSVLTYLTLGSDNRFITDVKGIFGIKTNGLQGCFYMKKDSVYTYHYQGKGLSGNISFGTPPLNCPNTEWNFGNNLFEFTINNYGTVKDAQETIDISNVTGCNAKGTFTMTSGGDWISDNQIVKTFYNDIIYKNFGKIGVFPFKCDVCTDSVNPPKCNDTLGGAKPQKKPICNVSRSANLSGGIVVIEFNGFTNNG